MLATHMCTCLHVAHMCQTMCVLGHLHACTLLTRACTMPGAFVHVATRNGTVCLHVYVSLHARAHVCNVTGSIYRTKSTLMQ